MICKNKENLKPPTQYGKQKLGEFAVGNKFNIIGLKESKNIYDQNSYKSLKC